jgi:hypothetical protein
VNLGRGSQGNDPGGRGPESRRNGSGERKPARRESQDASNRYHEEDVQRQPGVKCRGGPEQQIDGSSSADNQRPMSLAQLILTVSGEEGFVLSAVQINGAGEAPLQAAPLPTGTSLPIRLHHGSGSDGSWSMVDSEIRVRLTSILFPKEFPGM